ncbi:MAG: lipocalin family protein [Burkholderiales bacterium]|nr:lipocalin family protein [Burkholderiales bacterium]
MTEASTAERPWAGSWLAAAAAATSLATLLMSPSAAVHAQVPASAGAATQPLAQLDLAAYMGRWHQVALYPNRFQAQCLDSTSATYTLRPDGRVTVLNRCRTKDGWDETEGVARPRDGAQARDGMLAPASLEVNFLPTALRWLGVGWGQYDVLQLGPGQQWAVVSEPSQQYLWVLARTPQLDAAQWTEVDALLRSRGFDLSRLRREPAPALAQTP